MIFINSPKFLIYEVLEAFKKVDRESWYANSDIVDSSHPPLDVFTKKLLKHSISYSYADELILEFQYFTGSIEDVSWFRTDLLLRGKLIVQKIEPLMANPNARVQMQKIFEKMNLTDSYSQEFILYGSKVDPYYCFINGEDPRIYQLANSKLVKDILNNPSVR